MTAPVEVNPSLSREAIDGSKLAVVAIKPLVENEDAEIIINAVSSMAENDRLEMSSPTTTTLDEDAVVALYPRIFEEWGNDDIGLDQLRYCQELIEYMTSGEIAVYVLHGVNAADKALELKAEIRNKLGGCDSQRVRNFVHVPDEHEVELSLSALLGVEIE